MKQIIEFEAYLKLAIPPDIPESKHAGIKAAIDKANQGLAEMSFTRKQWAIERAALALHYSGAGACGIPSARLRHGGA